MLIQQVSSCPPHETWMELILSLEISFFHAFMAKTTPFYKTHAFFRNEGIFILVKINSDGSWRLVTLPISLELFVNFMVQLTGQNEVL